MRFGRSRGRIVLCLGRLTEELKAYLLFVDLTCRAMRSSASGLVSETYSEQIETVSRMQRHGSGLTRQPDEMNYGHLLACFSLSMHPLLRSKLRSPWSDMIFE